MSLFSQKSIVYSLVGLLLLAAAAEAGLFQRLRQRRRGWRFLFAFTNRGYIDRPKESKSE